MSGTDARCVIMIEGQFLESFDHDTNDGLGLGLTSRDPERAFVFDNTTHAFSFYRKVSNVRPLLADGRYNRPLTIYAVSFKLLKDVK